MPALIIIFLTLLAYLIGSIPFGLLISKAKGVDIRKQGSGNMVTTASTFGLLASAEYPGYCATKAAIINLTREMAIDYGPLGIRVNSVCPGAIETPRFRGFPPRPTLGEGREPDACTIRASLRLVRNSAFAWLGVLWLGAAVVAWVGGAHA